MRTFKIVTSVSTALTLTVALLSIIGIATTGFYPGIIVLLLITLIPLASRLYDKKINSQSYGTHYTTLTIINLLSILVVLWMTFVILIDRVFPVVFIHGML